MNLTSVPGVVENLNGTVQASYIVFWNKDGVEEHLTGLMYRRRTLDSEAFRCKNCELVIFYYGKNVKRF